MRRLLRPLIGLALAGWTALSQAGLAFFLFLEPIASIWLVFLPIPILGPLPLAAGLPEAAQPRPGIRRAYLLVQISACLLQLTLRTLVDLWLPVRF